MNNVILGVSGLGIMQAQKGSLQKNGYDMHTPVLYM